MISSYPYLFNVDVKELDKVYIHLSILIKRGYGGTMKKVMI